jgi:DNA-binding response OmpR family regulator
MKHVLVVDDEPTIRELVADALRESGYHVDTARDGAEALDLVSRRRPHAIVLDLMMPRMDGRTFVTRVRQTPHFAGVPILMVTAAYQAFEAAERMGATACMTKPFEIDDLIAMVDRLVELPALIPS